MNIIVVDGGGTKTRAWTVDSVSQTVLAQADAGASNFGKVQAGGLEQVLRELREKLSRFQDCPYAVLGLAGVGREQEHAKALSVIRAVWPELNTRLVTDAELAYRGAFCDGRHGILLIIGTGTIAFYRTPVDHEFVRAGGWGPLLGDEGGGNWLGRELIRLCLREWEEDELSALHSAVLEQLAVETTPQLITKVYSENFGPGRWAEVAPLIFQFAHESSGAMRVLQSMAIELVDLVERLHRKHLPDASHVPLVLMGGLWEQRELLQPLFEQEISLRNLPFTISEPAGGVVAGGIAIFRENG